MYFDAYDRWKQMIHNIPQPVLEQELTEHINNDPNITLRKGFSIHAVDQVRPWDTGLKMERNIN